MRGLFLHLFTGFDDYTNMRTKQEIEEKITELKTKMIELEEERPYLSEEEYKFNIRDRWWIEDEIRVLRWILE
jgi:hypothetical protein